jgi:hypothetical protein
VSGRIDHEVIKNHSRPPNRRRYSIETLVAGQELHAISPPALHLVRQVFRLPRDSLLNSWFAKQPRVIADAFQDSPRLEELIALWQHRSAEDVKDRSIGVAVDPVAFRPFVTITEGREVMGSKIWNTSVIQIDLRAFSKIPRLFPSFCVHAGGALILSCSCFTFSPFALHCRMSRVVLCRRSRLCVVGLAVDQDSAFNGLWRRERRHGHFPLAVLRWTRY